MKRIVLAFTVLLVFNISTAFAAPINNLSPNQTALGVGSKTFYLEHQLTGNFTLGYQDEDWNNGPSMSDVYGQLRISREFRLIIGSRDLGHSSKLYLGGALHGALAPDWEGYASLIAGDNFEELQIGANFALARNVDLNLSYHSFMPEIGRNQNGVSVGATFKF